MNENDNDKDISPYDRIRDLLDSGSEEEDSKRRRTGDGSVPGKLTKPDHEQDAVGWHLGPLYFADVLLFNDKYFK